MEVTIYLFLGFIALATSHATISRRVDEVLGSVVAMTCWSVWAFAGFNVEIVRGTDTGVATATHTYEALVFIGVAGALVMLLFLVRAWTGQLTPWEDTRYA